MHMKFITKISVAAAAIILTTLLASCEGNVPKGPAATTARSSTAKSPAKTTTRTTTSILGSPGKTTAR